MGKDASTRADACHQLLVSCFTQRESTRARARENARGRASERSSERKGGREGESERASERAKEGGSEREAGRQRDRERRGGGGGGERERARGMTRTMNGNTLRYMRTSMLSAKRDLISCRKRPNNVKSTVKDVCVFTDTHVRVFTHTCVCIR